MQSKFRRLWANRVAWPLARNATTRIGIAVVVIAAFYVLHSGVGIAAPTKGAVHTVLIEGMKFVPETIAVTEGDTVVWTNKDLFPHTVTAVGGRFDSHEIKATKSWKYVPRKKGEFGYVCTLHPTMKGMLVVK